METDEQVEENEGDDEDDDENSDDGDGILGMENIAYYSNVDEDPYLQEKVKLDSDEEDDMKIKPTDSLIAVGRMRNGYFNLEVYVYEEEDNNLYCHHDVLLSSFPLAIEWMNFDPGDSSPGNIVAIGSTEPQIELWDLDVIETLEPVCVLGAEVSKKKKKKGVSSHSDAVLDLSWNSNQRNALASASADFTVGLWDMNEGKMVLSLQDHKEKVQAVKWHPVEAQSLLSGSYDHTVKVYDCRSPSDSQKSWKLDGEVERVAWNPHDPFYFLSSTDKGDVYYMDVRSPEPLFSVKAHSGGVTGLSVSPSVPGCLFTASEDKTVKIWDIRTSEPELVWTKNAKMGEIHCGSFCPDSPLIAAAGGTSELKVVDLIKQGPVVNHFRVGVEKNQGDGFGAMASAGKPDDSEEELELEKLSTKTKKKVHDLKKKKKKKKCKQTQDADMQS